MTDSVTILQDSYSYIVKMSNAWDSIMQETIVNSILHVEFWIHSKCYCVSDDLSVELELREESEEDRAEDRDGGADDGDADELDAFSDDSDYDID